MLEGVLKVPVHVSAVCYINPFILFCLIITTKPWETEPIPVFFKVVLHHL